MMRSRNSNSGGFKRLFLNRYSLFFFAVVILYFYFSSNMRKTIVEQQPIIQTQTQTQQQQQQEPQQPQSINKSQYVQKLIDDNKLLIFSKTYCGFSKRIKQLFKTIDGVTPFIVELDIREDGAEIQSILSEISHIRTVPQLFINGKFIGGSDATHQLHSEGNLIPLLKGANLL
ncbi:hypothetical protein RB653_006558 [Dictyostelium firmibasis]|uniref:Glutaredoxin domain-containing protein n=1 Tax=Dictyostelium firmibasis TaxID=79012 RepID=A0AAN7TTU5_9MYCE